MSNKKPTIMDVADIAGCSIATVSRVLNRPETVREVTRKKIYEAMQQTGYRYIVPEQTNYTKNKIILVMVPSIENPFYFKIVSGIHSAANRLGYQYLIYQSGNKRYDLEQIQKIVTETKACGIVIMNPMFETEVLETVDAIIPVVQCCEYDENSDKSYVSINDFAASKSLVEFMFSRGKRKICLINGPRVFKYARQRKAGYEAAFHEAGIPLDPEWMIEISDINFDSALSVITQLLNREEKPDSFFAISDVFAAAAIKAARRAGLRVPEDIGVVGFDNTYVSMMCEPSLTTVNQPQFQLGFIACELLMERINNPQIAQRHILLETELIIRESI